MRCLVRGVGDVGSAVAHALCRAGHTVAIHDSPAPTAHRRGMAFVDAVFDGQASLEGIVAQRIGAAQDALVVGSKADSLAVYTGPFDDLLALTPWGVLVDARMRKRAHAEDQRGHAALVIGLGPGFTVGENCHTAVETGWDDLGTILTKGSTASLRGEPRALLGHARDRLVYAPRAGIFNSIRRIGDTVKNGETVGTIDGVPLCAPLSGILRGLTRSGVRVDTGTKLIEIDPRGDPASAFGLGERPQRIAEAVLRILTALPRPG
jgi:xanthine dehydrogenase accessory factor